MRIHKKMWLFILTSQGSGLGKGMKMVRRNWSIGRRKRVDFRKMKLTFRPVAEDGQAARTGLDVARCRLRSPSTPATSLENFKIKPLEVEEKRRSERNLEDTIRKPDL